MRVSWILLVCCTLSNAVAQQFIPLDSIEYLLSDKKKKSDLIQSSLEYYELFYSEVSKSYEDYLDMESVASSLEDNLNSVNRLISDAREILDSLIFDLENQKKHNEYLAAEILRIKDSIESFHVSRDSVMYKSMYPNDWASVDTLDYLNNIFYSYFINKELIPRDTVLDMALYTVVEEDKYHVKSDRFFGYEVHGIPQELNLSPTDVSWFTNNLLEFRITSSKFLTVTSPNGNQIRFIFNLNSDINCGLQSMVVRLKLHGEISDPFMMSPNELYDWHLFVKDSSVYLSLTDLQTCNLFSLLGISRCFDKDDRGESYNSFPFFYPPQSKWTNNPPQSNFSDKRRIDGRASSLFFLFKLI